MAGLKPYVGLMLYSAVNSCLKNVTQASFISTGSRAGVGTGISRAEYVPSTNAVAIPVDQPRSFGRLHYLDVRQAEQMRDPTEMARALTRVEPLHHAKQSFSPEAYLESLNAELSALAPEMFHEIQAAIPRALSNKEITSAQIKTGLDTLCHQIKASPIHIGFVCNKKMLSDKGEFWPSGKYFNRPLWYSQKGYKPPSPRPFEPKKAEPEHYPIYAALNLGLKGHSGWGGSYFVLKPEACQSVELRSRDTGEPDGIGYFALKATRDNPLPLVADWIRMGLLPRMWAGMTGEQREVFSMSASTNTEAAIFSDKGYINTDDIALIVLSKQEAEQNDVDLSKIQSEGVLNGVPVIIQDAKAPDKPFYKTSEYQAVMAAYAADAANPKPELRTPV